MFLNILGPNDNWRIYMFKGFKVLGVAVLLMICKQGFAQQYIIDHTKQLYGYLNAGDSAKVSSFFHEDAYIMHVGNDTTFGFNVGDFLGVCPRFKSGVFQEKVHSMIALEVAPQIVTVKVEFMFYYNGKYSHCGIDHYTWIQKDGEMLVQTILSTDNVTCGEDVVDVAPTSLDNIVELNRLMNNWHKDIAAVELDAVFDFLNEDFFYLGTDPSERWSKVEFRKFCEPYFLEKKQAWDFKPSNRNWGHSPNGKTYWFDESLDTWMEGCRGSGVVQFLDGEWKLSHYNLTVLIENEKIKKFIKLRKK
jgi:ketosteroid isomerase-like protein